MSENQIDEIKEYEPAINKMRSLHKKNTPLLLLNKEFVIQREVFHPNVCLNIIEYSVGETLKLVEKEIRKRSDGGTFDFLEVGCGAGYASVFVALSSEKCRVWATDINEAAVENTKENAKLHGVENQIKVAVADVFNCDEIIGRRFDVIFWNLPWCGQFTDEDAEIEDLMKSIMDPSYRSYRRFLLDASSFLKNTGRLFVGFSFNTGSPELFKNIANENGWDFTICASENIIYEIDGTSQDVDVSIVEFLKNKV